LKVSVGGEDTFAPVPLRILTGNRLLHEAELAPGEHEVQIQEAGLASGRHTVRIEAVDGSASAETTFSTIPGWLSVVPPLLAIALALLFRDVLVALFTGVFVGALTLHGWNPFTAFGRTIDTFIADALADPNHAKILIFSALLGGMVGVMSKSGGTQGIVERLKPLATTPRRGQVATWCMGVLVFFDDYANSLIVGSTMQPITDRLKISREKLAYIVDSTAAPIASIMPISTWVGFEVGLLLEAFDQIGLPYDAYTTFVFAIPYNFYPILALVMGLTIAISRRDLGPMLKAERRAFQKGQVVGEDHKPLADYASQELEAPPGRPRRAINALLPILTVIGVTLLGLYVTGTAGLARGDYPNTQEWIRAVSNNVDSYSALLWASLAGVVVAILLATAGRVLKVEEAMTGLVGGFKAMLLAFVVLILAWSLGAVCENLHTADFLVGITSGVLSPHLLPTLVFIVSAAIAFATGTSWATMSILVPLVIPIFHGLAVAAGHGPETDVYYGLLLGAVAAVLAGAVWGDHCSPISDTTILSSMGSGCDHIAHVRTQLPYALTVGVVAILTGSLPSAYGVSPWISLAAGSLVLVGLVRWRGRRAGDP
jgi:Na+/H+ antiporter NhaC